MEDGFRIVLGKFYKVIDQETVSIYQNLFINILGKKFVTGVSLNLFISRNKQTKKNKKMLKKTKDVKYVKMSKITKFT